MLAAYTAEICFDVVVNASSPALAVGPMLRVFRKICVFDAAWLQRMRYLLHAPVKSISFHRNVTYGCLRHRSKGIQSVGSGLLWVGDRVLNLIRNGFDAFTSLCLSLLIYTIFGVHAWIWVPSHALFCWSRIRHNRRRRWRKNQLVRLSIAIYALCAHSITCINLNQ